MGRAVSPPPASHPPARPAIVPSTYSLVPRGHQPDRGRSAARRRLGPPRSRWCATRCPRRGVRHLVVHASEVPGRGGDDDAGYLVPAIVSGPWTRGSGTGRGAGRGARRLVTGSTITMCRTEVFPLVMGVAARRLPERDAPGRNAPDEVPDEVPDTSLPAPGVASTASSSRRDRDGVAGRRPQFGVKSTCHEDFCGTRVIRVAFRESRDGSGVGDPVKPQRDRSRRMSKRHGEGS